MPKEIQPGWALLRVKRLDKRDDKEKAPRVDVLFEIAQGAAQGELIADKFFLSVKAISRFETLAHRAGVEAEIKRPEDVTVSVFAKLLNAKVYGLLKKHERYGWAVDAWNFRPETNPPEEELFRDYTALDERDAMLDGLE